MTEPVTMDSVAEMLKRLPAEAKVVEASTTVNHEGEWSVLYEDGSALRTMRVTVTIDFPMLLRKT